MAAPTGPFLNIMRLYLPKPEALDGTWWKIGADRFVRISDLPPVRRYAPQSPDETDLTKDMATGRLVLRAYSPVHDTEWSQEWGEATPGELVTLATTIANALEDAAKQVAVLAAEAERRARDRREREDAEWRLHQARERARARAQAKQVALDQLNAIVNAWSKAHALEAFFSELDQRAAQLETEERAELE